MKRFALIPAALAAVAFALAGCSMDGTYAYRGYDSTGRVVVVGELQLDFDPGRVTGTWSLAAADTSATVGKIGPQIGQGSLEGTIQGDTLRVDLNPTYRDNNVTVVGAISGIHLTGRWDWSGIGGIMAQGTFEAVRH